MQKTIDVILERIDTHVLLVFKFEQEIKLDLTSDNQEEVKLFFQKLLAKLFDDFTSQKAEYCVVFKDPDGKDLFHDVGEKYVSNLNTEIQSIYAKLS